MDEREWARKAVGTAWINLDVFEVPREVLVRVRRETAQEHRFIPVALADGLLVVALEDPARADALEAVALQTGLRVEAIRAGGAAITRALARYYDA